MSLKISEKLCPKILRDFRERISSFSDKFLEIFIGLKRNA